MVTRQGWTSRMAAGMVVALLGVALTPSVGAAGDHHHQLRAGHRVLHPATTPSGSAGDTGIIFTDVPARIEVGSFVTRIRFGVGARVRTTSQTTELYDNGGRSLALIFTYANDMRHTGIWREQGEFIAPQIPTYGAYTWSVAVAGSESDGFQSYQAYYSATVRAHSLLGLATSRVGNAVTITVATRAYNNVIDRYQGWPRRGVYIQKRNPDGSWASVAGITTDGRGNARGTIATGPGVYRAYDKDTGTVWGQLSATSAA